jgi:hypothetical protein
MKFRDPSRELIVGETRRLEFDMAAEVGANSISGTPTVECTGLTFTNVAASGTDVIAFVSGGEANKNYIVEITATLSSNETVVGAVELQWKAPGYDFRAGRR